MKTLEEIKNFVDIPEGWKITEKVKKSQHHPDCSWVKAKMLCDCGVLDGAIEMRKMDYKLFKSTISQTKQELIEEAKQKILEIPDETMCPDKYYRKYTNNWRSQHTRNPSGRAWIMWFLENYLTNE